MTEGSVTRAAERQPRAVRGTCRVRGCNRGGRHGPLRCGGLDAATLAPPRHGRSLMSCSSARERCGWGISITFWAKPMRRSAAFSVFSLIGRSRLRRSRVGKGDGAECVVPGIGIA